MIQKIREKISQFKAIIFILSLTTASIMGVVIIFNISANHNIRWVTQRTITNSRQVFEDLAKNSISMLSATMKAIMNSENISRLFQQRDRQKLYDHVAHLFDQLQLQNGITHWYFIDDEQKKTCFLRVHAPFKFGDTITRITYNRSLQTNSWCSGIELGKTAFALRVVHPWHFKGEKIGFLEMGMEINHFFEIMKNQTGGDYCLLLEKKYLDPNKWKEVTEFMGMVNKWDDDSPYIWLRQTECEFEEIYPEIIIDKIPDQDIFLKRKDIKSDVIVTGMFPLFDAANQKVGGVLVTKNLREIMAVMEAQKNGVI